MSDQITTAFVTQFQTNVDMLAQQMGSRLRGAVTEGRHVGEQAAFLEQFGVADTPQSNPARNADTPNMNVPQDRRWVFPTSIDWGYLLDNKDKLRMIIDPTSSIAQAAAATMNRKLDDVIVAATFGTALTGKIPSTPVTFPAGNVVANTVGASGATGLNVAKLREARRLLLRAEIDPDMEPLYAVLCADKLNDLLNDIQVTSRDFNGGNAVLENGRLTQYLGIQFIHSERFLGGAKNGNGTPYETPVWAKSGLHLGIWSDLTAQISIRDDKSYATQLYTQMTIGASRTEEAKVIKIASV